MSNTNTAQTTVISKENVMVKYPLPIFNPAVIEQYPESAKNVKVLGYHPNSKHKIPVPRKSSILLDKEFLRDMVKFLNDPRGDALMIVGETGSGKTTGVLEIAAYLNWPVREFACTGSHENATLKGMYQFRSNKPGETPSMTYVHGSLAKAMLFGEILLINEFDMGSPEEMAGLNDVLSGRPLIIEENGGEVIYPHPAFRIIATANSNGGGDETGNYQGVQTQNMATIDRFQVIYKPYMSKEEEIEILNKKTGNQKLPVYVAEKMVDFGADIRALYNSKQLSRTFSTRTLVRWGLLMLDYHGAPDIIGYTLNRAFINSLRKDEIEAVQRIAKDHFGDSVTFK